MRALSLRPSRAGLWKGSFQHISQFYRRNSSREIGPGKPASETAAMMAAGRLLATKTRKHFVQNLGPMLWFKKIYFRRKIKKKYWSFLLELLLAFYIKLIITLVFD
jgi:hypothetical protein